MKTSLRKLSLRAGWLALAAIALPTDLHALHMGFGCSTQRLEQRPGGNTIRQGQLAPGEDQHVAHLVLEFVQALFQATGKTLLLLGCNFPDWLDRFFIHALTRGRGIDVQFVSEYSMGGLYDFLKRKRARPSLKHSPVDFVAELFRRWQQGAPKETHDKDGIKFGAVFISYAREDQVTALKLRKQLEDANIDTWMDESGLEPGAEFKDVIHDNIRNAAFFVALISRSLDLQGSGRLGRFVFREWKWAEDAAEDRRKDDHFLQPVVIDETPPGASFIERPYRDLHWASLKEGLLPQEFIDFVKKGIRQFRSESGGGR